MNISFAGTQNSEGISGGGGQSIRWTKWRTETPEMTSNKNTAMYDPLVTERETNLINTRKFFQRYLNFTNN
jgi:hypothetical protein